MGSDTVRLIIGLGNPGKEYEQTRHNIGFMMLDNYVDYKKINTKWSTKFNGKYIKDKINGEETILLKPQSFMNLSGGVVKKYVDYFKIPIENVIVISDDMDLFVGNFKIKDKGSCGGHNGLRDIEKNLGTSLYKRIKIGIAKDKSIDTIISEVNANKDKDDTKSTNKNKGFRHPNDFQRFAEIDCSLIIHIIENLLLRVRLRYHGCFPSRMKYHIIMGINRWHLFGHVYFDVIIIG